MRGLTRGGFRDSRGRKAAGHLELQLRGGQRQECAGAEIGGPAGRGRGEAGGGRRSAPRRLPRRATEAPTPMTSDMLAGRRLITLVFDVSSMQPEDVQRAVDSAKKYVDEQMSAGRPRRGGDGRLDAHRADRFHRRSRKGVARRSGRSPTPTAPRRKRRPPAPPRPTKPPPKRPTTPRRKPPSSTCSTTTCGCARLKTLAEALSPIEQKKIDPLLQRRHAAQRPGQPGRAAIGDQRRRSRQRRRSMPSIRAACRRSCPAATRARPADAASRSSPAAACSSSSPSSPRRRTRSRRSRPTPAAARSPTRTISARRSRACSATCPRTTCSATAARTPTKDGRFRRIQVRVKRDGMQVEARAGYYADRDFTHTSRTDRETQLDEQMFAAVSATDLPVLVTGGWFRLAPDKLLRAGRGDRPGSAVPVANDKDLGLARRARAWCATNGTSPSADSAKR